MRSGDATPHDPSFEHAGRVLVLLQFALLALLAWRASPLASPPRVAALALLGAAVLLGLWALSANPPGNFNIRPTPRDGGVLVTRGPYRWIRHPMYAAVLLAGLAAAVQAGGWPDAAAWAALLAVLAAKAGMEERALLARHAGYAAYRAGTKRFVPWLL